MSKTLNELAADFVSLKNELRETQNKLLLVEQEMLVQMPAKDSGTVKEDTADYHIEVQFKQENTAEFDVLKRELPADVFAAVTRTKYEVDARGLAKFIGGVYGAVLHANTGKKTQKPWVKVERHAAA